MTDNAMAQRAHDPVPQNAAVRRAAGLGPAVLLPAGVAAVVCLLLVLAGQKLLNDPDTYWQIVLGQAILDSGTVPQVDTYSWTMRGAPWISTQWLSQVMLASSYGALGWAGPVLLTAAAVALTLALLARLLLARLGPAPVLVAVTVALALSAQHLLARPHVLALPIMVAWVGTLVRAADQGRAPPLWLAALMVLWANMHGGFILGLALMAPLGLDALLNAKAERRVALAARWALLGAASLVAACLTPYGVESILAARKIVGLGEALAVINEWKPQDFAKLAAFEVCLLAGIGFALLRGFTLPPLRILVLLGLLHMALAHVRNAEVLALIAPLLIAAPLARQLASEPPAAPAWRMQAAGYVVACMLIVGAGFALASTQRYAPNPDNAPAAAVAALKQSGAARVFNAYEFGGYLIASGVAPFIDGRTELYGTNFVVRYQRAVLLQDVADFVRLLDEYKIDATLLSPQIPAAGLLDQLPGWKRLHADATAVVHVRTRD